MFWVTDNFLMHHSSSSDVPKRRTTESGAPRRQSFDRARFRMQTSSRPRASDESESEILLSGDDELIGVHDSTVGSVQA